MSPQAFIHSGLLSPHWLLLHSYLPNCGRPQGSRPQGSPICGFIHSASLKHHHIQFAIPVVMTYKMHPDCSTSPHLVHYPLVQANLTSSLDYCSSFHIGLCYPTRLLQIISHVRLSLPGINLSGVSFGTWDRIHTPDYSPQDTPCPDP